MYKESRTGIDSLWRNYNNINSSNYNMFNTFRDKTRENYLFSNPTPRVGIIIRCPFSSVSYLKPIDVDNCKQTKYIYLTVYQAASFLWGFPKGRLNVNRENYYQGALRELREETGIILNTFPYHKVKKINIKRGKHHHYYFLIDLPTPPFVNIDNREIVDYRWATLDWLSSRNVSFFTENVIDKLRLLEDDEKVVE